MSAIPDSLDFAGLGVCEDEKFVTRATYPNRGRNRGAVPLVGGHGDVLAGGEPINLGAGRGGAGHANKVTTTTRNSSRATNIARRVLNFHDGL